jgi:hypothetical protein
MRRLKIYVDIITFSIMAKEYDVDIATVKRLKDITREDFVG